MFMTFKTAALAAVFAVSAAVASASTVSPERISIGDLSQSFGAVTGGNSITFSFTATEDLRVLDFLSTTGNGPRGSIGGILLQLDPNLDVSGDETTPVGFDVIRTEGATETGSRAFAGFLLREGETFSFTFENGAALNTNSVFATLTFVTAAVPVPAAGLLLMTALLGGGAIARRKKKQQLA